MLPDKAARTARPLNKLTIDWGDLAFRAVLPIRAIAAALLIGAVLMLFLQADPIQAYVALVEGALGTVSGVTQSLVKAAPLLLVGLGICIAFRASVVNLGGEGQIIVGALMAACFALAFRTWPGWLLVPATLTMSFLAGAAWGFVPSILRPIRRNKSVE